MLCNKKRKVCIFCMFFRVLIAMSIYCHYSICIFIYHNPMRIHAESPHQVFKLCSSVHNLALIKLICQMRKYLCWQFHAHANIHPIRLCRNLQVLTKLFSPFAAASAPGNNALAAKIIAFLCLYQILSILRKQGCDKCIKIKVNFILQIFIYIFENDIVNICPQMAYRCIEQVKSVLEAELFDICIRCRI